MDFDDLPRKDVPILFNNRFADAIETQLIDYCDIHDLLAVVVASTQNVAVFRINGQVAFQIARKDHDCAVCVLKWKRDGSLLGIGWSDGMVGVYSGEDGKLMSQTTVRRDEARDEWKLDLAPDGIDVGGEEEPSTPACMGWTTYTTAIRKSSNSMNGRPDGLTTEDWVDGLENDSMVPHDSGGDVTSLSRLAKSIATLDVTAVLPRLSSLPVHALRFGPNEQKFTTQAGVDTLFDAARTAAEDMTTFVTSSASGHTNVYLGDSVSLGHFPVSDQRVFSMLASHPHCTSQAILSSSAGEQPFNIHYIDLPLHKLRGSLLHVITTQTTRIQILIDYITQTLRCLQSDLTSNLQLPNRIIANISEDLSSQGKEDLVTGLYHLAMAGTFSPPILEWLTESIRENTHKRWDKAVNDMYNHIQNHIFVNLIPALDRLAIASDTIRGHARMHQGTDTFVPPGPFAHLMDDVDSLRLTAQKLQLLVVTEHRQFRAFSKWLRVMIEVGSAGPGSKAAIETEEREVPNIDYPLVLAYIKHALTRSALTSYLGQRPDMKGVATQSEFWSHPSIISSKREEVVTALQIQEAQGQDSGSVEEDLAPLLNLSTLAVRMIGQARLAITSITKWQSETLSPPQTIPIDPRDLEPSSKILDVKMYPTGESGAGGDGLIYILSTQDGGETAPPRVSLLLIARSTASRKCETSLQNFPLAETRRLLHAEMLDHDRCIALTRRSDGRNHDLVSCNLRAHREGFGDWMQVLHSFSANGGFEPAHFVVGGRLGKTVCVVCGVDGRGWKVFDLDQAGKATLTASTDNVNDDMGL